MSRYKCSDGRWITKEAINRKVSDAKAKKLAEQLNEFGYHFCEICKLDHDLNFARNGMEFGIIDCSHEISVDECQKTGHSELAWDMNNINILCRYHHQKHDKLDLKFTKNVH
jgi:hypothetical protein